MQNTISCTDISNSNNPTPQSPLSSLTTTTAGALQPFPQPKQPRYAHPRRPITPPEIMSLQKLLTSLPCEPRIKLWNRRHAKEDRKDSRTRFIRSFGKRVWGHLWGLSVCIRFEGDRDEGVNSCNDKGMDESC